MPTFMPSRSDTKQSLSAGKRGRKSRNPLKGLTLGEPPMGLPPARPAPMGGMPPVRMKNGGSASSRADGIAKQGKTKGTMVKMCGGGKS